jgi:hypothetical protein
MPTPAVDRVCDESAFELLISDQLLAEEAHHSFGHDLIGQTWYRRL